MSSILTDNFSIVSSESNTNIKIKSNTNTSTITQNGDDLTITSPNQITMSSYDNVNINPGVNFVVNSNDSIALNAVGGSGDAIQLNAQNSNIYQQTQYVKLRDGVNDTEILLDMRTTIDQIPTITLSHNGQITSITNDDNLNINSDEQTFITSGKAIIINSLNDNISLWSPNGILYVDRTEPTAGDGQIVAAIFNGNLNGNAASASFATSAGSAGSATTASFASYAGQISTTGIATGGGAYSIPFVVSATSSANQTLYTDSNSHLTFNPTTNQLNATGTITNAGLTMNGSASQFLINNNSASVPAISAPNALLVNFPSATITATTFAGGLSGNSTTTSQANGVFTTIDTTTASNCPIYFGVNSSGNQATKVNSNLNWIPSTNTLNATNIVGSLTGTASNASAINTTSDNTSGTYYIPFTKTLAGTGKTLYIDDTSGPLSYNPSTSSLTCSILNATTINGSLANASSVASNSSGALTISSGSAASMTINSTAGTINLQSNGTNIAVVQSTGLSLSQINCSSSLTFFNVTFNPLVINGTTGLSTFTNATFTGLTLPATNTTATFASSTLTIPCSTTKSYMNFSIGFTGTTNTISTITLTNAVVNGEYYVAIYNGGSGNLTINATSLGAGVKSTYTSAVVVPTTGSAIMKINYLSYTTGGNTYVVSVNLVA